MIRLDLQNASVATDVPAVEQFRRWAEAAIPGDRAGIVIRIVDREESAALNVHYRHKSGPTNVLSFPFEVPKGVPNEHLGDLVICAPLVIQEAAEQGKPTEAHWAHLTVHGLLHLQGYDHLEDSEAAVMEAAEIAILRDLGIPNPYQETASS